MKHFNFELNTTDRLKLSGQCWKPEGEFRAVVCIIHGHGEHSGRYVEMADILGRAGYAVIAFDLRGHGRSEGRRGHAPGYTALMSDIALLLDETASRFPGTPRFLYGHSLGGNLAVYYVLKNRPDLAGVIVAAPLFRLAFRAPRWKTALLDALYALHLSIPISTGLERDALSRDQSVLDDHREDPLAHKRITPPLALGMLRNGEWILQHAGDFPLPILVMHGRADRITSVKASGEFASKAGRRCTLKIWDGFYHELHNEPEKEQVFDFVLDWLDATHARYP